MPGGGYWTGGDLMRASSICLAGAVMGAAALFAVQSRPASLPSVAAEIHYSPDEDLEAIDVREIASAQRSIDVAAYVLTDFAVASALRDAGARGVRVRIWRDPEMAERTAHAFDFDQEMGDAKGVESRIKSGPELMHLKGYCVDGKILRTGSANFSKSGLTRQDNDLVLIVGPGACDAFERKFEKAWNGA